MTDLAEFVLHEPLFDGRVPGLDDQVLVLQQIVPGQVREGEMARFDASSALDFVPVARLKSRVA